MSRGYDDAASLARGDAYTGSTYSRPPCATGSVSRLPQRILFWLSRPMTPRSWLTAVSVVIELLASFGPLTCPGMVNTVILPYVDGSELALMEAARKSRWNRFIALVSWNDAELSLDARS